MSTPQQRLGSITAQLSQRSRAPRDQILEKNENDVVITVSLRTALTKARKGLFKDTQLEGLLVPLLKAVREKSNLDPALVEEIVLGNVLHGSSTFVIRGSAIAAGYPVSTAASTVSRWCSSGLLAVQSVANQISAGNIDIGLAVGAESMSSNPDNGAPELGEQLMIHPDVVDITKLMGWTSENVAQEFGISRKAQDEYAARSFQRAETAQGCGWTAVDEIIPIKTTTKDPKTGEISSVVVKEDDGIRHGTTTESLGKIKAAFPQWKPSTTTGGNASQITDGAAALLLMRRSTALRLGQPILGKFVASTVVGSEPRIMGIAPTIAIPKLLSKVNLTIPDIDIFEINEAFSSMAVYCVQKLGLDIEKVNPRGGAIAFGHPLGCTGARQIVTALSELKRGRKKIAVTSMCVGTGMGMAAVIVSEQ